MESDLRLILLGVGLIIVGGIILDGMRRRRKLLQQNEADAHRLNDQDDEKSDPLLEGYFSKMASSHLKNEMIKSNLNDNGADSLIPNAQEAEKSSPPPQMSPLNDPEEVLALTILPCQGKGFSGRALISALQSIQMQLGSKQIFHRYQEDGSDTIAFSLASLTEPGTMAIKNFPQAVFPGLLIFMTLPGPCDPLNTLEQMMTAARQLSGMLVGELCDYKGSQLTIQAIENYREQVRDYMRRKMPLSQQSYS